MNFHVSYPLTTVVWDGKTIRAADATAVSAELDAMLDSGVTRVMLAGYHDEEPATFDMAAESARIGNMLRARGVTPSQHHGLAPCFGDDAAAVVRHLKSCVEYTANLGAPVLVIHAGRIGEHHDSLAQYLARFFEFEKKYGTETLLDMAAENLRQAGEYAASLGVRIALENLDRFEPMCDPVLLPQLVDKIALDNVGYCFDSGHAWCSGTDFAYWISTMGKKMFTTHLHDNRGPGKPSSERFISCSGIDEHLSPGFGTIDWRRLIALLRTYTTLDTATFETGPWPLADRREAYCSTLTFWKLLEQKADSVKTNS